jgi:SAM-dependent methyltransferase
MSQELIFDRNLLLKRRVKTAYSLPKADFLIKRSFEDIQEKLQEINQEFPSILNLGSRNGYGYEELSNLYGTKIITESNICNDLLNNPKAKSIVADEENLTFENNQFDIIISILNLHSVNDLPGCLFKLRKALKPNGVLIASMFGGENLPQLRQTLIETELAILNGISPRMMPNVEIKQLGSLTQRAGFNSTIIDKDTVEVHYKNPLLLLKDLQNMGENNIMLSRNKSYVGKKFWSKFVDNYIAKFSTKDGNILASFEILTITALC